MSEADAAIDRRFSVSRIKRQVHERCALIFQAVRHITLFIPILVMCMPAVLASQPTQSPARLFGLDLPAFSGSTPASIATEGREVFSKLLERHLATQASLSNLVYLSLLCIGVTLVLLARRQRHPLTIQGIPVPLASAYLAIAVIMTYLWVLYIWSLNRLVEEHRALWQMLSWLESAPHAPKYLRTLLQSSPLIDAWAQRFLRDEAVIGPLAWGGLAWKVNWAVTASTIAGCAAAVGLAHACVFAILDDAIQRWKPAKFKRIALNAVRIALCLLIICTYAWFELRNRDWWFSIAAAWFAYIWVKLRGFLPGDDAPELQAAPVKAD